MSDLVDLLCDEDFNEVTIPNTSNEIDFISCNSNSNSAFFNEIEQSIVELVVSESDGPDIDSSSAAATRFQCRQLGDFDSVRQEFVSWILKVNATYELQPLTACLSVCYLDRYLATQNVPADKGWVLQLVCVACFSLAAKLEESRPPNFRQVKVECEDLIPGFHLENIYDIEIHVLTALDWRMRPVTPFTFIDFFAKKVDSSGMTTEFLISRTTNLILTTIEEISILDYSPSSMAAGAILIAAREVPKLSSIGPENALEWCPGLNKDRIEFCFELLQDIVIGNTSKERLRKRPKFPPHLRARTPSETMSSGSSPSSTSISTRKRKLEFNDKDTL